VTTSISAPDPEATAQWFEGMLGAEILRSMQEGKPRIDLKLGGTNIFIAPVTASTRRRPRRIRDSITSA
jgi:lactoylglutathione lyase